MKKFLYRVNNGYGDHIICKGIYNQIPKEYDKIIIFVEDVRQKNSLKFLYDYRAELVTKEEFDELYSNHQLDDITEKDCFLSGFEYCGVFDKYRTKWNPYYGKNFLEQFYNQVNLPVYLSWTAFDIGYRDVLTENQLLQLSYTSTIFIHDCPLRNFIIKDEYKIGRKYIFPYTNITNNIFNWIPVLQRCKEIHCIDSCFSNLADRIQLRPDVKLYLHNYAKKWQLPTLKKKWTIIN